MLFASRSHTIVYEREANTAAILNPTLYLPPYSVSRLLKKSDSCRKVRASEQLLLVVLIFVSFYLTVYANGPGDHQFSLANEISNREAELVVVYLQILDSERD